MDSPDKLPLAQRSMALLLDSLRPTDTVAIVVYAGAAGQVLRAHAGQREGNDPAGAELGWSPAAQLPAPKASSLRTRSPRRASAKAASIASSWPPMATSTSASPTRTS